jgi:hypothetical protein
MLQEVRNWGTYYQGGNMWAPYDCYLTAARDILGLQLPIHEKYSAWEQCAIEGSFRFMHKDFCMVSDFPAVLKVDDRNRPHCEDGPSHQWRDGWSIYHWHGVRIPDEQIYIIDHPNQITASAIDKESNQEIKRVMIERFGLHKYVQTGTKIHQDDFGTLYQKPIEGTNIKLTMVHVVNGSKEPDGTYKDYFLEVHPELRPLLDLETLTDFDKSSPDTREGLGAPQTMTARNAVASTYGMRGEEYMVTVRT